MGQDEDLVHLLNVKGEIEACFFESVLNENGISMVRKYCDGGSYINMVMGSTSTGIDIYVSRNNYQLAREIVDGDIEVTHREELEITSDEKQIFEEARVMQQKKRTLKGWIVLCLLIPSVAAILLTTLYQFIGLF